MDAGLFDPMYAEPDSPYGALCHPRNDSEHAARNLMDCIFRDNRAFVGKDLAANAKRQLHQCFWELYLADALRRCALPLVPRAERPTAGPDFRLRPSTWIEAVAPGPGQYPDGVPAFEFGSQVARDVPDRQIQLRYLSALAEKARKLTAYRQAGLVGLGDPYVIALNGGDVSHSGDFDPPRIARVLFGIGWPVATVNVAARRIESMNWQTQLHLPKANGTLIEKSAFLDPRLAEISAVLFSSQTAWTAPDCLFPGRDFIVVHNPYATSPMPRGFLPAFLEFCANGDQLQQIRATEDHG